MSEDEIPTERDLASAFNTVGMIAWRAIQRLIAGLVSQGVTFYRLMGLHHCEYTTTSAISHAISHEYRIDTLGPFNRLLVSRDLEYSFAVTVSVYTA